MNNENKYFIKFLILVGILIVILVGYAGFNFFNISGIFNEKPIYYFCSYHDDYYLDMNDNQIVKLKNDIQNFMEELDYVDEDYDNITFQSVVYEKNKDVVYYFFLVDDEMNTLYAVQFDKRSNSWDKKFVWNGDDDNRDYHDESIKYSYLYIVDKDRDDPDIDNADQYSQDMVTSIVVDSGKGEQIWIDGQKALIKGIILANCQANVSEDKKNFYSVYQTLALLGGEQAYNNNPNDKKMKLSAYMNSLDETDIARTAYTTITNSPEKTRGSFMTSALATLQLFSSIKLMKVLSKSDFSFREFTEGKRALFIVNPDEKKTYDRIAGICFDQSYQTLVFEANRMQGRRLKKKVHMIYDEFGNMPTIDAMQSKMTVALSRGIVYHLYVQGFDQLNDRYDESIARIIRGNCNLTYFISSADLNTCKEVAESIGDETIWGPSHSANYNPIASSTGSGVNYSMSKRQLVDANELMVADNRDGNGIIVKRTYFSPSKVYLPDCSEYPWYEEMKTDETEISKVDRELNWAVPRCFELRETEIRQAVYTDEDCNSISMSERRRPILTQKNSMPSEKELYWYWSMRDDLSESVKKHVIQHIANCNKILSRKEIMKYLKSKEFFDYINPIDVADKQRHSTESADRVKMVKTVLQSFDNNSSQKQSTLMKKIDDLSVPQLRELASVARVIRDGKARNG